MAGTYSAVHHLLGHVKVVNLMGIKENDGGRYDQRSGGRIPSADETKRNQARDTSCDGNSRMLNQSTKEIVRS